MRTPGELHQILQKLLADWESEVVEFKQADHSFKTAEIGRYFSALSNEANLRDCEAGWLVFGIENKTRSVVGTTFCPQRERLMTLKNDVRNGLEPSVTFREIHELLLPEGRVILFEVPPAPAGMPIGWNGHRYARSGESLCALGIDKEDRMRAQSSMHDWTAEIVPGASLQDLDPTAAARARHVFLRRNQARFEPGEIDSWENGRFLDRIGITLSGKITRTALLLLGCPESAALLNPHPAQITWKLVGEEEAYEHFGPPFFLNTTAIFQRIRNIKVRLLPAYELISEDVQKYEQKVVLEGLHNAIAHQDYRRYGRVILTEYPDALTIENEGSFAEGDPGEYIAGNKTPRRYRNTFLVQAMVELGMIDTMGYGIHRMYREQAKRSFPLPDYDLSSGDSVRLKIHGRIMDPAYSRLLLQRTDLSLHEVLALDRIQKRLSISDDDLRRLRKAKLIEGRRPNLHISAKIAAATGNKADYIRTRGQDDAFYEKLILDYIGKFGSASRAEIDGLLLPKLSDALDDKQKENKVRNLLTKLRKDEKIENQGSRGQPKWTLLNGDDLAKKRLDSVKKNQQVDL